MRKTSRRDGVLGNRLSTVCLTLGKFIAHVLAPRQFRQNEILGHLPCGLLHLTDKLLVGQALKVVLHVDDVHHGISPTMFCKFQEPPARRREAVAADWY